MGEADPSPLGPGVTVLGNLAVDRIDGAVPSPGGCPTFAGPALLAVGTPGRVVTRAAPTDLPLFADAIAGAEVPVDLLPAEVTSGFGMHYDGDERTMTVDAVGPVWSARDLEAAAITTRWVHVAPLLRSDFPAEGLAALAAAGHRIAYDGQGLVRRPTAGPLVTEAPPVELRDAVLAAVGVLKLAGEEAAALMGPDHGPDELAALGVAEVLITAGSQGCDLYLDGSVHHHIPAAWQVEGVHATGAGDVFTVAYVAARSAGDEPVAAAHVASQVVAEMLQTRRETQRPGPSQGAPGTGHASGPPPA